MEYMWTVPIVHKNPEKCENKVVVSEEKGSVLYLEIFSDGARPI